MEPVTLGLVALGSFVLYRVLAAHATDPEPARPAAPSSRLIPADFNPAMPWPTLGNIISVPEVWISTGGGGDTMSLAAVNRVLPAGFSYRRSGDAIAPVKMGERVVVEVMRGGGYHSALEGAWEGGADTEAVGWVNVDRIARRAGDDNGGDLPLGRYTIPASDASGYHQYLDRAAWFPVTPSSAGLAGYVERYGKLPALSVGSLLTAALRDASFTTAVVVVEVRSVSSDGSSFVVAPKYVYRVLSDAGSGALKLPGATFEMSAADAVDPSSLLVSGGASTKGRFDRSNVRSLRG